MNIAVVARRFIGHVKPMLPVIKECIAAGHSVVIIGEAGIGRSLRMVADDTQGIKVLELLRDPGLTLHCRVVPPTVADLEVEVLTGRFVHDLALLLIEHMRAMKVDMVVRDCGDLASMVAAERLEVPTVSVGTLALQGILRRDSRLLNGVNDLRGSLSLPPIVLGAELFGQRHIDSVPPPFYSDADSFGSRLRLVQPTTESTLSKTQFAQCKSGQTTNRSTVLVTLGTLATNPKLMLRLSRALKKVSVRAYIASDKRSVDFRWITRDADFYLAPWLPMNRVLPECSLVICHGGYGTVKEALAAGVPMLIAPQAGDQRFVADTCVKMGIARELAADGGSVSATAENIRICLEDQRMAESAHGVVEELSRLQTLRTVVSEFGEPHRTPVPIK